MPEIEWIESVTFGQGDHGRRCVLCNGNNWSSRDVTHRADCPAERYPTRKALFAALKDFR